MKGRALPAPALDCHAPYVSKRVPRGCVCVCEHLLVISTSIGHDFTLATGVCSPQTIPYLPNHLFGLEAFARVSLSRGRLLIKKYRSPRVSWISPRGSSILAGKKCPTPVRKVGAVLVLHRFRGRREALKTKFTWAFLFLCLHINNLEKKEIKPRSTCKMKNEKTEKKRLRPPAFLLWAAPPSTVVSTPSL